MHITVNNEQIEITFNPNIYVNVLGPEHFYYVEVREYVKDNPESKLVEAFHFNRNANFVKDYNFYFFGEFYGDYEISVFKFVILHALKSWNLNPLIPALLHACSK